MRVLSRLASLLLLVSACGSSNARPPHYGVYLREGAKLVEMERFRELPDPNIIEGIPTTKDTQPAIIVWLDQVNLQWLVLGPASGEGDEIEYDATPQSDGVLELHPSRPLTPGRYCLIQGDPLGVPGQFPIWCFSIADSGRGVPVVVGTETPGDSQSDVIDSARPKESSLIVVVNDLAITTQDYQKRVKFAWLQSGQVADPQDTSLQVLDQMVDEVLLNEQAKQRGIAVTEDEITKAIEQSFGYQRVSSTPVSSATPDAKALATTVTLESYEELLKEYLTRLDTEIGMSEADFRKLIEFDLLRQKLYDDVTKDVPAVTEQVHVRHILAAIRTAEPVAPSPVGGSTPDPNAPSPTPTPELRNDAQALARILEVQQKLGAGEDFGELAQEYSDDRGSAAQSGDLGWVGRGQGLAYEFEDAAFKLQPGQISNPVKTQFGYHIIQVEERDPARALDSFTLQQMKYDTYNRWLTDLRNTAKVQRLWSLDKLPPTPPLP